MTINPGTPRCGARKKTINENDLNDVTCLHPAGYGTDHLGYGTCKYHLGNTPAQRAAAQKQRAVAIERVALADSDDIRTRFGIAVPEAAIDNPLAAYRDLAGRVVSWVETCEKMLEKVKDPRYMHEYAGEQLRAEVVMFERSMGLCNQVLAAYGRLKVDERLAAIDEAKADMILRALEAGLAEIGVAGPRALEAKAAVARHLRLVS